MDRTRTPLSYRLALRVHLRYLRRRLSPAGSCRRRLHRATRRQARHARQPRPRGRPQRPVAPRAPFQAVSSLSHHPTRPGETFTGVGKSPLRCRWRGCGPTDARDVADAPPGQQPVFRPASFNGFSIHPETHGAASRPSRSAHASASNAVGSMAAISRTTATPRRRRRAGPHLGDLGLGPFPQQAARIIGPGAHMATRRPVGPRDQRRARVAALSRTPRSARKAEASARVRRSSSPGVARGA